jgi:hypothetical protein
MKKNKNKTIKWVVWCFLNRLDFFERKSFFGVTPTSESPNFIDPFERGASDGIPDYIPEI